MLPLLFLVVTSTALANRQSPVGFKAAVRKSGTTPHGTSQERLHTASQRHTPVDITCARKSDGVCRFIASVAPSSDMDTRGGLDKCRKDMVRSLSRFIINAIYSLFGFIITVIYHVVIFICTLFYCSQVRHGYRYHLVVTMSMLTLYLLWLVPTPSIITAMLYFVLVICLMFYYAHVVHGHRYNSGYTQDSSGTHLSVLSIYLLGLATPSIVTAIYRRYDKWWRQPIRMKYTRNLIETDEYPYKYPVFVSASRYLDDAALRQLTMALEGQLHISCNTDRQLVCSREHIKAERRIVLETMSFLEESGMMVIVISDRYNECLWCEEELAQARMLHKPILIIQFGDLDETKMNPILRKVIRENIPITMDDEYNITPDWKSVCNVILQLLPCPLDSDNTSMLPHSLLRPCVLTYNVIRQQY